MSSAREYLASLVASGRRYAPVLRESYVLIGFWVFVAIMLWIRLGATLIGTQTLVGYDLLDSFAPWSSLPTSGDGYEGNPYVSDQIDSQIPAAVEVQERLAEGDWPLQSNLVQGGASLMVQPSLGYLTPTRWTWLVLPLAIAPGWTKLLEIVFGMMFTYLLTRRWGFGRIAASVAGFAFAFSGFVIAWSGWPQATVVSLVPMLFWAVERFVQLRRWRDLVPVSLASAFLLLGGFPIVAGHSFVAAGLFAVIRCMSVADQFMVRDWLARVRALLMLGVGVIVGALISMVQLLPFLQITALGTSLEYRDDWSKIQDPLRSWLSVVLTKAPYTGASYQDHAAYIGAVVVVLAAIGILAWLRGGLPKGVGTLFIAVCVFVVGFISFQSIGNWGDLVNGLPLLAQNPPGRLRAQLALPVAVFAGLGVQWLMNTAPSGGWRGARWLTPGFQWPAVVTAAIAALAVALPVVLFIRAAGIDADFGMTSDAFLALIPVGVVFVVFAVATFVAKLRNVAILIAGTAIVVQALAPTAFFWPVADIEEIYPESESIDFLAEHVGHDQVGTVGLAMRPNVPNVEGVRLVNGHGFATESWLEALQTADPMTFSGGGTYSYFQTDRSTVFENETLDALGVTYVVAAADEYIGEVGRPAPLPGTPMPIDVTALVFDEEPLSAAGERLTISAADVGVMNGVVVPMTLRGEVVVEARALDEAGAEISSNLLIFESPGTVIDLPVGLVIPDGVEVDRVEIEVTPEPEEDVLADVRLARADPAGAALAVPNIVGASEATYPLVYAGENVLIWERQTALPRLRFSENADGAASSTGDLAGMNITSDTGDLIAVEIDTQVDGYLAVAQSLGDGYVATVDGAPVEIVEGAPGVYSVPVPSGVHLVEITFAPRSVQLGQWITVFGIVILVGLATVGPLRDRLKSGRIEE